jgi:hypothetical protein
MHSFVYQWFVEVLRAKDKNLQRMQKISRERREDLIANKSAMKQVLYELLVNCNYIPSINDPSIPDNVVYCFGKNEHCRNAKAKIMRGIREKYKGNCSVRESIDWEEPRLLTYAVPATDATRQALDALSVKLPRILYL